MNGFFFFLILFSSRLQAPGTVETAREREGYVIQSTANAKEVFRTIGGYVWREGCGKKTKRGEGAGGDGVGVGGLYLHRSQKPKRMRSEANPFIFRADGGNAQYLAFFCRRVFNLHPKESVAPAPSHLQQWAQAALQGQPNVA